MDFASRSGKEAEAQNIQAMSANSGECGVVWGTVRTWKGTVGELLRSVKGDKSYVLERRIENKNTTI